MNYNRNTPFTNTTNSFIGDPYSQSSTLQSALRTDNDNYVATTFQAYQQSPGSAEFSGACSNTNQLSPVQTNQGSVSPQRVTLQSPQMQYGQSNPTPSTSPGNSGEGLSYMQNPSPYQSPNNQFFLTTTEKLSPIQATQTQLTPQGVTNYLNVPTTCTNPQMGAVQMPSYSNNNDEITLEDALSFLDEQEARQYTSPQQQQQQQEQQQHQQQQPLVQTQQLSPLPTSNIATIGETQTQSADQYQQLLLLDSDSSISSQMLPVRGDQGSSRSQNLSPATSNTIPSEQQSQKSSLSPENSDDVSDEMSARFCEHFGLLNETSDDGPTLKEEGIFSRYDLREVAQYIVKSLFKNNYCIVDFLHGEALAANMLEEVKEFHQENAFSEGLLSSSKGNEGSAKKNVREDLVAWTDGKGKKTIKKHMSRMDLLLKFCNKLTKECEISSRTQVSHHYQPTVMKKTNCA